VGEQGLKTYGGSCVLYSWKCNVIILALLQKKT
jgi:hypothetical protein